jgi:hypothetical protein
MHRRRPGERLGQPGLIPFASLLGGALIPLLVLQMRFGSIASLDVAVDVDGQVEGLHVRIRERTIQVGHRALPLLRGMDGELNTAMLRREIQSAPEPTITIEADDGVPYDDVIRVIDACKSRS